MAKFQVVSPIDGRILGDYNASSKETIRHQMEQARIAAISWGAVDAKVRAKILGRLTGLILAELDAIVAILVDITGKVKTEALLGEIYPVLDLLKYYEKNAARILQYQGVPTSPFTFPGATAGIARKPYGVVAVISPWNYPFQLAIAPMLSTLFAGNAVILKPSEISLPIGPLIMELLAKLDLPKGLVQLVIGDGTAGQQLIDAAPDLVFFTGSLATGRVVMQRAGQHPIPVLLELGGKDAMLVFDDADLDRACDAALYGAFCNSGQACVAIERLYVQQSCYHAFVERLQTGLAKLEVAHGTEGDMGTMTSPQQFSIVLAHYQDAMAKGAKASSELERLGNYVKPVVLWDVRNTMQVMQEETFGPLLPVMAFDTEANAVSLANDSNFGLNASIWSSNIDKATRVAQQLQVGNWAINDVFKNIGHPGLPFGGVKKSGFGRYHGAEGLRNFTYPVSGLTSRSSLPKEPNWFPYNEQRYEEFKGYLDFVHGPGTLVQRIKRNWLALQAFREYSGFDLTQRWQNLKLMLTWKRNY